MLVRIASKDSIAVMLVRIARMIVMLVRIVMQ